MGCTILIRAGVYYTGMCWGVPLGAPRVIRRYGHTGTCWGVPLGAPRVIRRYGHTGTCWGVPLGAPRVWGVPLGAPRVIGVPFQSGHPFLVAHGTHGTGKLASALTWQAPFFSSLHSCTP